MLNNSRPYINITTVRTKRNLSKSIQYARTMEPDRREPGPADATANCFMFGCLAYCSQAIEIHFIIFTFHRF